MAKEKVFENRIKKFLKDNGCWFIKYWGGGEFTKAGVPDLLACVGGKFVGIELKSDTGRPSTLQLVNLRKIEESGGYGILLYPKHEILFKNFVDCIKAGDEQNTSFNYDIFKGVREEWQYRLQQSSV